MFGSNLRVWPSFNLYQKKSPDTVAKLVCDVTLPRLATPIKESGLSSLHAACIEGDIKTVKTIMECSPDKLYSAIALRSKLLQMRQILEANLF